MPTILLVDDDEKFLGNLRMILEFENFKVYTATNAKDGIMLAQEHQPDMVVCDIRLDGSSGFDVVAALRKDRATKAIPVILLSGWHRDQADELVARLGITEFLMKPIAAKSLVEIIKRYIASTPPSKDHTFIE